MLHQSGTHVIDFQTSQAVSDAMYHLGKELKGAAINFQLTSASPISTQQPSHHLVQPLNHPSGIHIIYNGFENIHAGAPQRHARLTQDCILNFPALPEHRDSSQSVFRTC
jgi:hypothetical protein